jgi:pyruvate,water dikinase
VAAAGAGNKAALLDRSKRAGLPVPTGYVLLAEAKGRLRQAPAFQRKIAVRAAFSAEDHPWESLAGFFLSKLWVDAKDAAEFNTALEEVWQSAVRRPGEFRRDILLHEMVDAHTSGAAFTERDFEDDLVNWTRGTGERLVAGDVRGYVLDLPKLRRGEASRLAPAAPAFAARVQGLLRDIRRVFGPYDWDVEWADDERTCWLLQIRPTTRPRPRDEVFVPLGCPDMLPEPLPRFHTSVISTCAPAWYGYFREFDPSLPNERLLVEVLAGRPLINASLLCDTVRMLGLPETLASSALRLSPPRPAPLEWRRMVRKRRALARLASAQFGSMARARRSARKLRASTERVPASFRDAAEQVRWFCSEVALGMFPLAAAGSLPRLLLARLPALGPLLRWQVSRVTQARELLWTAALGGWDRLRHALGALAAESGLPEGSLWLLSEDEVMRLDDGWRPPRALLFERQREMEDLAAFRLPGVLRRSDDFESYRAGGPAGETPVPEPPRPAVRPA